jgi:hypothetical protein
MPFFPSILPTEHRQAISDKQQMRRLKAIEDEGDE